MASYLQIENISKSYGPKVLFEHIGFNINEGDKIALVAPNGTGKTSLMRILAGKDKSDSGGKILFLKDIRIAFLEQDYDWDPKATIMEQIIAHNAAYTSKLDQDSLWQYELRIRRILSEFRIDDPDIRMETLSGGGIKKVAITEMLAGEAEFLIMDEPTNHLDIDSIEYLENTLSRSRCTLLMVTHDRYFLDRVCNTVMELDHGAVYTYRGDYQNFLEKRDERVSNYDAQTDKVRNILRRELQWIRSTPCARSGKARYRINAFHELSRRVSEVHRTEKLDLSEMKGATRLGTKIIDCSNLTIRYGDRHLLDGFTYRFQRYEKVGIVGRNGSGKTTLLNILTGGTPPGCTVEGSVERGESLKIGYYRQSGMSFNPDDTVLDIVSNTALLGRFLFPHEMYNSRIATLSGGEKRRLYLLTVLMQQPNLLILDEPTNDLDIVTLNILEEYLKEFQGSLIIVSHDRHFLDRLADHLLVLCGDGVIKDFIGLYSEYRAYMKDYEKGIATAGTAAKPAAEGRVKKTARRKLTFREQREMEQLEKDLESLSAEKKELEALLGSGTTDYAALQAASTRIGEIIALTDEKELRWLELSDI